VIAVSDTSPLNYLVLIDGTHILPALFDQVVVPQSVKLELSHERTPRLVRSWIETPPPWLLVQTPAVSDSTILLGSGERDAICLAKELKADIVLVDDRAARRVAKDRELNVMGTLGLLDLADARGLIDLAKAMDAIVRTTFRIRADAVRSLLDARSRRRESADKDAG
jgi:predicted nucleic acid-binding protein